MDIMSIIGIGLIAVFISILLRQYKAEYAMLVSLAAGIVMLVLIFADVKSMADEIKALASSDLINPEYIKILFKALGICFVTQIACDTCKDAGESAMSVKIEMAGKLAVLVATLPMFRQVLNFASELLRM